MVVAVVPSWRITAPCIVDGVPVETGTITVGQRGHVARLAAADRDLVDAHGWSLLRGRNGKLYARTRTGVYMHRLIAGTPAGYDTDHEDGDGLHNCWHNVRKATHAQNMANQAATRGGRSRFKGVIWDSGRGRWRARITIAQVKVHLGYFTDEADGAQAYNAAALAAWGPFARLNILEAAA